MSEIPEDIIDAAEMTWAALEDADGIRECVLTIAVSLMARDERSLWQLVGTAPKEEMVLVCDVNWPASLQRDQPPPIKVGYLDASMGTWKIFGASWLPTHWHPLPSPPKP